MYLRLLVRPAAGIGAVASTWPRQVRDERHGEVGEEGAPGNPETHLVAPTASSPLTCRTHGLYPSRAMVSSRCCQGGEGEHGSSSGEDFSKWKHERAHNSTRVGNKFNVYENSHGLQLFGFFKKKKKRKINGYFFVKKRKEKRRQNQDDRIIKKYILLGY